MTKRVQPEQSDGAPPRPTVGFMRDAGFVLASYTLSAALLTWIFPPGGLWPLAFIVLVPWTVATCRAQRAWLIHWLSFLVGWGFFLVALRWLAPVTPPGYIALGGYLAIYWTLAAWAIRTGRRHGISPIWTLPVTWVACEYLRAVVMTGFPWLFVAHSFHEQLHFIQISDIAGAYGVSFVAIMVNGVIVEFILRWLQPARPRKFGKQFYAGAAVTTAVLIGTLTYGQYRLGQIDFDNSPETHGPRVAVIQEDFPLFSKPPFSAKPPQVILASYLKLAAEAAKESPDLIVFPEAVWGSIQNRSFVEIERKDVVEKFSQEQPYAWAYGNICDRALAAFARGDYAGVNLQLSNLDTPENQLPRLPAEGGPPATLVVGSVSVEQFPDQTYPKYERYNSALIYDPDGQQRKKRYDKCHLVPFGEYVPFRQTRFLGIDLHYWLYRPLNRLAPWSRNGEFEYSSTPGKTFRTFPLQTERGMFEFGVPICYEDATPRVPRKFVWDDHNQRRADFLINISNDAWFLYSNELPQHLAICVFRAVENRVGIARSVNTGISGFIDPNGRIYSRIVDEEGRSLITGKRGIVGYDLKPIYIDRRFSFYGCYGDWLPVLCVVLSSLLWLGAVFERWVLAISHRLRHGPSKGAAK